MNWYKMSSTIGGFRSDYADETLVEEARSFSDSSNVHRLNGIIFSYLGAAMMLAEGSRTPEKHLEIVKRKEKELKDFISVEKLKRV